MRQLLPDPVAEVDPYDAARPHHAGPLLRLNVVASVDGSATDEQGRSGGLGGPGDRTLFRALRAHADAVLVGAGTVRAEGYGPHRLRADLAERRAHDGRAGHATIVVVSRSLDLDFGGELFAAATTPTTVLTCTAASPQRRRDAARAGCLLVAGDREVDLADGLRQLRARGATQVLSEGGPHLARALLQAGLVDELFLTLAPTLAGTGGPRVVEPPHRRLDLVLERLLCDGSELYLRYRVDSAKS